MNPHFRFAKSLLLVATASIGLIALPQFAAAQPGGPPGGPDEQGQPVPYAGGQQQDRDNQPPPPPPPPPPGNYMQPPPPPANYGQNDDGRRPEMNNDLGYHQPPRGRCQMVEDRVIYPDGTTESSSVQACRDRAGHWHVMD